MAMERQKNLDNRVGIIRGGVQVLKHKCSKEYQRTISAAESDFKTTSVCV